MRKHSISSAIVYSILLLGLWFSIQLATRPASHVESTPLPLEFRVPPGKILQANRAAQDRLTRYIAKTYRVSRREVAEIVHAAVDASVAFDLDPLLILAVVAAESSFNCAVRNKEAIGCMQVVPKWHAHLLKPIGGQAGLAHRGHNIRVGAQVLSSKLVAANGDVVRGLLRYSGSITSREYPGRVLRLKRQLAEAI